MMSCEGLVAAFDYAVAPVGTTGHSFESDVVSRGPIEQEIGVERGLLVDDEVLRIAATD